MRTPIVAILPIALLAVTALSGCSSSGDGSASVYVKDAPTDDFREVHLVITGIAIHQSGGNGTSGWTTLFSGSQDIDLLNVTGTRAAFLGEASLPVGKYQQTRLTASSAYGIAADGTRVEIGLPNGELKVTKGFRVEVGQETQLVLDLDLDRSLTEKGGSWEFKPVIGKLSAAIVDKDSKPAPGTVETLDIKDDAAA